MCYLREVRGGRIATTPTGARVWWAAPVAWLGLVSGCLFGSDDGLRALDGVPISFAEPRMISVRSGETLATIALREQVPVEDLIAWNGLQTSRLDVGQVLLVWPPTPSADDPRLVAAPKPRPRVAGIGESLRRLVVADTTTVSSPSGTAEAGVAEVQQGGARIVVDAPTGGVRGAGVTNVDLGDANIDDLARTAQGMERHDADLDGDELSGRGSDLTSGGAADDLEFQRREAPNLGPKIPNTPVTPPRLTKPAAKRCLSGPSGEIAEDGVVTSNGLSVAQINAGMAAISRYTPKCFPRGTEGTYTVIAEVTVGCDGRVRSVFTVGAGSVPSHVTSCIEQTLGYAGFAAHAVPDGVSFQYPMKFSF